MSRVGKFFALKANRIGQGGADGTMKCKQRRAAFDSCPQNLWFSLKLEPPDSTDRDRKGVRFHPCQSRPNCFIVLRREFSEGIQGQVHFLSSSEAQTWEVVWLQRNEAIFCLIGERDDKEIAWHGRHSNARRDGTLVTNCSSSEEAVPENYLAVSSPLRRP